MTTHQSPHDEPDWHGQKAKQKRERTVQSVRFRWFVVGLVAALCFVVVIAFFIIPLETNLNNANVQATSNAATQIGLQATQTAGTAIRNAVATLNNWLTATAAYQAAIAATQIYQTLTSAAAPKPSATAESFPMHVLTVTANSQWTPQTYAFSSVSMVLVPPGCFMMGSDPKLDPQAQPAEQPQTKFCFQQPFWIDQTPVTQAQFKQFGGQAANNPVFGGDQRPVESITWFEAKTYCEQQRGGRLPTEAEFEYAARGPDNLIYPWGNNFDASKVVYTQNSGRQTAEVGSKPGGLSWVGALDMSGNVWEWTSSIFKPYPYKADDGRERNDVNSLRVLRGGSWANFSDLIRAAFRYNNDPSYEHSSIGFRCARTF